MLSLRQSKACVPAAFLALACAAGALAQQAPVTAGPPVPAQSLALRQGVKATKEIAYVEGGSPAQRLDLYVPQGAAGPLPLVIWIHGGAWLGGDKQGGPAMSMIPHGYAVASVNYRLSQEAVWPAQIHDCKAAVRWLRAHAKDCNLDPDRFGAWGGSAGGHLVAMLGTSGGVPELEGDLGSTGVSSRVQAVCDWFGPSDFTVIGKFPSSMQHDAADSPESKLLGGAIQDNLDKARQASPITWVSTNAPPFLIMHGDQDMTVPLNQSEILAEALKKAGVPVQFVPVPGAGHGFGGPELLRQVSEFFDENLKRKP